MADEKRRVFIGIHGGQGIFVGLLIVAIGVALLLDQQGIVSAHRLFHFFWPAVFIFFGLENLLAKQTGNRWFGGVLFAIGAVMLLGDLGYIPVHIGFPTIWPLLLIGLGLAILISRFSTGVGGVVLTGSSREGRNVFERVAYGIGEKTGFGSAEDSFNHVAVMSGTKQRITTRNFKGGKVIATWGGFQLDLRGADIQEPSAEINVIAFMGGGEIRVPDNWIVDIKAVAFMGGFVDETRREKEPDPATAKRLIVKGAVVMGGVVIKS
jgi:hypothetical protein